MKACLPCRVILLDKNPGLQPIGIGEVLRRRGKGANKIRFCEGATQGNPIAIVVYTIAIVSMILMIVDIASKIDDSTETAAYVDDVTAARKFIQLKNYCKTLCMLGPRSGYYPEESKSWLIVRKKVSNAYSRSSKTLESKPHLNVNII